MPAFEKPLHVGRPHAISFAELCIEASRILDSRRYSNDGRAVRAFEEQVAEEAGTAHAVAVSSGTVAIEVMLRAAGLDGEVRCPSFTFVGTASGITSAGLEVALKDVDERGLLGDATAPWEMPMTSLGVHLWGQFPWEAPKGRWFYDGAHAFGCRQGGRRCGTFGIATALSFHATKLVTCGEGGAVVTNDAGLAEACREVRNFGFKPTGDWEVATLTREGINGKMSELNAAMGLVSLKGMGARRARNACARDSYMTHLEGIPGVSLVYLPPGNSFQHLVLMVTPNPEDGPAGAAKRRDGILQALWAEGVRARRYFHPGLHRTKPYEHAGAFPMTEHLSATLLHLPTGESLEPKDIPVVCDLLRKAAS